MTAPERTVRPEFTLQEARTIECAVSITREMFDAAKLREEVNTPRGQTALETAHLKLLASIEIGEALIGV